MMINTDNTDNTDNTNTNNKINCCICGTVKNCGKYLPKVFSNVEKIGNLFNDYEIIVYYDNSNDDTLQQLLEYQNINRYN